MRKLTFSLVVLAALVLSACKPAEKTTTPEVERTTVVPDAAATVAPIASKIPADCAVSPVLPVPDASFVAALPPVNEQDWMLGPASAQVTLIEYTDYQ